MSKYARQYCQSQIVFRHHKSSQKLWNRTIPYCIMILWVIYKFLNQIKYVKCGKMVRYYSFWSDQKFWYPNIPNRNRSKKKWISFENFPRCNSKFQPNATSNATAGYITSPVRITLNSSKIRLAIKCFHSPWRKQQKISWSQKKILVALCRRQNFSVGCFLLSSTKKKKLRRFYMRWLCTEVSTFLFTFDLDDTYGSLNIWL